MADLNSTNYPPAIARLDTYPGVEGRFGLPRCGNPAPPLPGLVSLGTSQTKSDEITIDPGKTRHRRLAKGIIEAANLVAEELADGGIRHQSLFMTLTFRPGADFGPRNISAATDCLRKWASREGHWFRYIWRMEFGEKFGRVHYHVVVWLPEAAVMPRWDNQGWWPHGFSRTEVAYSPVGYLAKYASKASSVPSDEFDTKGARWWGHGGLPWAARLRVRIICAPAWVREKWRAIGEESLVRRLPFGWWLIGGWEFRSPWEMVTLAGGVKIRWRGWEQHDFELSPA